MPPPPPPPFDGENACAIGAGWKEHFIPAGPSAGEVVPRRSIATAERGHWLRRLAGFMGPGYLVAVGYMDPGNWATDLAGGSGYGYALLWVIMLSNLMAMLLQILAARLGIVTGFDLAQACRARYSRRSAVAQWLLCEVAICACDLAEVIGTAIALKLLFGIPLFWGASLTVLDVLLVLWLQQRGFRRLEAAVMGLLCIVFGCFAYNLWLAQPDWHEVATGLVPDPKALADPAMLYLAIGIIGATVMPHNLYLHSSTVQTRHFSLDVQGKRSALRFASMDVVLALLLALAVNAAILVTAASVFHVNGHRDVAEIEHAYALLAPLLGTSAASLLFGIALLVSGLSSTLTATLAGQIVMEGYMRWRLPPWVRRMATRLVALLPALALIGWRGEAAATQLLIFSQVLLSLQLPFAVVPLIRLTSDRGSMGAFANPVWVKLLAWTAAALIVGLNLCLLVGMAFGA